MGNDNSACCSIDKSHPNKTEPIFKKGLDTISSPGSSPSRANHSRAGQATQGGAPGGGTQPLPLGKPQKSKEGQTAEDAEEESDDEMDDAEFEKMQQQMANRRGSQRNQGILAENWKPDADWRPPMHPKTDEQRARIEAAVSRAFMFAALEPKDLRTVIDAMEPHEFAAGSPVIQQGAQVLSDEPGLYIIEEGTLDVYKGATSSDRGKKVFTYDKQGQSFGELALLYSAPRAATVVAQTRSLLWSIDRNTFNFCVKDAARKQKMRYESFIETVGLLKSLNTAERAKVADALRGLTYQAGEHIIREGTPGHELFILEEGGAEARRAANGEALMRYGPAECFGERALMKNEPRACDVVATVTPTKVLAIDRETVTSLLGNLAQLLEERAKAYDAVEREQPQQEEASEDEDEASELDEAEFLKQQAAHEKTLGAGGRKTRQGIVAESWKPDPGWRPPCHAKGDEQRRRLEAALSGAFMFAALDQKDLTTVIDAFMEHTMQPGTVVITQGQDVDSHEPGLYVIESGKLDVYKAGSGQAAPGNKVHTYDQQGQLFGELALLYSCPRAATVVAQTVSTLWSIDRSTFNFCVKDAAMRQRARYESFLESVDLLRNLSHGERSKVADALKPLSFVTGQKVISQGEVGQEFFIVEEGRCDAKMGSNVVKTYNPGDYFGELALLKNAPRACDVVASSPAKVLSLNRAAFNALLGPLEKLMKQRAEQYGTGSNAMASVVEAPEDEEEDDEDDVLDDAEFEKHMQSQQKRGSDKGRQSRAAIVSEAWKRDPSWKPPVNKKTPEQRRTVETVIAGIFMFAALEAKDLSTVVDAFKKQDMKKDKDVILQGDMVDAQQPGLFIVESGILDVYKNPDLALGGRGSSSMAGSPSNSLTPKSTASGSMNSLDTPRRGMGCFGGGGRSRACRGDKVFTYDQPGAFFGELAMLYNAPRAATVTTRTKSTLWSLDRNTFNYCVKDAAARQKERYEMFLGQVELLKGLDDISRSKIADVLFLKTVKAGENIIRKGDVGKEFYILEEGRAAAQQGGQNVREYGARDYFGELALMRDEPRAIDVVALDTPTILLCLDRAAFKRLLGPLDKLLTGQADARGYGR